MKKTILWIIGVLAVLAIAAYFIIPKIAESRIENRLSKANIAYKEMDLDFWTGDLSLRGAESDSTIYRSRLIQFDIPHISIQGISWWNFISNNTLNMSALNIREPYVKVLKENIETNDTSSTSSSSISSFTIEDINISNGYVVSMDERDTVWEVSFFALKDLHLSYGDSLSYKNGSIRLKGMNSFSGGTNYTFSADSAYYDIDSQDLIIADFYMKPKNAFAADKNGQMYQMSIPLIEAKNIHRKQKSIDVAILDVKRPDVQVLKASMERNSSNEGSDSVNMQYSFTVEDLSISNGSAAGLSEGDTIWTIDHFSLNNIFISYGDSLVYKNGSVELEGVSSFSAGTDYAFSADSLFYDLERKSLDIKALGVTGSPNTPIVSLSSPEVEVKNIERKNQHFDIAEFNLVNPDIQMRKIGSGNSKNDYSLTINQLNVNDGSLTYRGGSRYSWRVPYFKINNLFVTFDNKLKYKNGVIEARDISTFSGNKFYDISAEEVTYNIEEKFINLIDFRLNPRFSPLEHGIRRKKREVRMKVNIPQIQAHGVYTDLRDKKRIYTSLVEIFKPDIEAITDARVDKDSNEVKRFPQELFLNMEYWINVDEIKLYDSYLRYEKIVADGDRGYVFFSPLNATFTNVTNIPSVIRENNIASVDINTKLYGESDMDAHFKFNLSDEKDYSFDYSGTLTQFYFPVANVLSVATLGMRYNDGNLEKMTYDFDGKKDGAQGPVRMIYKNVEIELMDRRKFLGLKTFAANLLFVRHNNLPKNEDYIVADVDYSREKYNGFFDMWWFSIDAGMRYIMDKRLSSDG